MRYLLALALLSVIGYALGCLLAPYPLAIGAFGMVLLMLVR